VKGEFVTSFVQSPGLRFQAQVPSLDDALPRMDVALFVGLASRGEANKPVVLEDVGDFERIFGPDLALAWDAERGEVVRSELGPAVRAFFAAGGRRCWVVRVECPTLAEFSSAVFLDQALKDKLLYEIESQANFIQYEAFDFRTLTGLHLALTLDEVTLVAVPDSIHRRALPSVADPLAAVVSQPLPSRDWAQFTACQMGGLATPQLELKKLENPNKFELSWSLPNAAKNVLFVLEEASNPDFLEAVVIARSQARGLVISNQANGDFFYRVRAELPSTSGAAQVTSAWSNGLAVRIHVAGLPVLEPVEAYSHDALLDVHLALLRVCAVRGDLFAVLSLPAHQHVSEAKEYVARLRSLSAIRKAAAPKPSLVPALSVGEERALSFGAVYHPWLIGLETGDARSTLRKNPPDGAMLGIFAAQARDRGAWVAPSNQALRNVLALEPEGFAASFRLDGLGGRLESQVAELDQPAPAGMDLFEANINVIAREPQGVLTLTAMTLSDDPDWRQINVRRLFCLLRRLAVRIGNELVFEPNNGALRRAVQRRFEAIFERLFNAGAFAGRTPEQAFRVLTGLETVGLNTPASVDQGRLFVDLCVAPSHPLEFLTVRLLQTGDRINLEERR
jgi:Phage tail sheath C-terminal domain